MKGLIKKLREGEKERVLSKSQENISGLEEVKFSLTSGDSQISFKGVIPEGDLGDRQYCLIPAPKHILK